MPNSASVKWFPLLAKLTSIVPFFCHAKKKSSSQRNLRASVAVFAARVALLAIHPFPFSLLPPQFPFLEQPKYYAGQGRNWVEKPTLLQGLANVPERSRFLKESFLLQTDY